MEAIRHDQDPILVMGKQKTAYSVTVCLLAAGHPVTLCTEDQPLALQRIQTHLTDMEKRGRPVGGKAGLTITEVLGDTLDYRLAIVLTEEDLSTKQGVIAQLEKRLPSGAVIGINTESIPLSHIQAGRAHPGRILGMNWVEPAHTTYFLELVTNAGSDQGLADAVLDLAKTRWGKDPYRTTHDQGIRMKMFAAMVREACYLVEHDYASVEDIDRACRNDAGYYLPFAGNCRYMDLMGAYAYGMVMKDLNPELSKEKEMPAFFEAVVATGGKGMENGAGFYRYGAGDAENWAQVFRQFSYEIQAIIDKYPFNDTTEHPVLPSAVKPNLYE